MSDSVRKIEMALDSMKTFASKLSVIFLVLFVADCLFMLAVLIVGSMRLASAAPADLDFFDAVRFGASFVDFIIYGAMLLVMRGIAKEIAESRTPFTFVHAKRIRVIAWLFVVSFVLSLLNSPNFSDVVNAGGFHVGIDSARMTDYPAIFVDIKSLVGAIAGFSLSSAWRYGALLQADSDEFY